MWTMDLLCLFPRAACMPDAFGIGARNAGYDFRPPYAPAVRLKTARAFLHQPEAACQLFPF